MKSRSEYANIILGFLQNIDDADDAQEFVRIALDALENDPNCIDYHRGSLRGEIASVDTRIE
jgi:hypothetical protein